MMRKMGLLSIALMGLLAFGGCQTTSSKGTTCGCPGGVCRGGSCPVSTTTNVATQAPQGGYAPGPPAVGSTISGGSGSR